MENSVYSYDEKSLIRDGKRWFPIMGEIHYSRYPEQYWKEALLKMKAGGVDIVSSYVIWIHHEEVSNDWDFSTGNKNLRKFVETVKECGLKMFLRIGPWCHAEVRNGGFPDWFVKMMGNRIRTNNGEYLEEVEKFYTKIYEQVKDLLHKDGGPVIGIQIENEYGHCGGLTGEEGEKHMRTLTQMAKRIGFDVPYYTATGWGGAVTGGLLPVMGGYCDAPWDSKMTKLAPSGNFVFSEERNDHAIGSDYGIGETLTFDMKKFPYLTAELGGGLQVTYKRRPVATAKDVEAMSICKIGSGCSLLGYYMYHGGTNPDGKLSTLQESTAQGSACDLPEKNYDFRAPLDEYGHANESYKYLRRLSLFIHDYGEELCNMDSFIPEDNPRNPNDFKNLRYAWRYNKETGREFLFVNNYQKNYELYDHYTTELNSPAMNTSYSFDLKNGESAIISHTSWGCFFSPLCKINGLEVYFPSTENNEANFLGFGDRVISYEDSLNASKITIAGKEYLIISDNCILFTEEKGEKTLLHFELNTATSKNKVAHFKSYPPLPKTPAGFRVKREEYFDEYTFTATLPEAPVADVVYYTNEKDDNGNMKKIYKFSVAEWPEDPFDILSDVVLSLSYYGDCARLYDENHKLISDNLYIGDDYSWNIGLKRLGKKSRHFTLEIDAAKSPDEVYIEKRGKYHDLVCVSNPVYTITFEE